MIGSGINESLDGPEQIETDRHLISHRQYRRGEKKKAPRIHKT